MDKKLLRQQLRIQRRAYPNDKRLAASTNIAKKLFESDEYKNSDAVLVFISTRIEVDTSLIIQRVLKDKKTLAAPKCNTSDTSMVFNVIHSSEDLEYGAYDIMEPKSYCETVIPTEKSLCIVPGLAYDINGQRIGFGRGYYDRFLEKFVGISCGVCFEEFIFNEILAEPTDVPINMLVSQNRIRYFCY